MRLSALLLLVALPAAALPPPPERATTDCAAPVYAADQRVCGDAVLRKLDARLAALLDARETPPGADDEDWFRRSRQCAFEDDGAACLRAAYCARLALLDRENLPASCLEAFPGARTAASISRGGFARDPARARALEGTRLAVCGYVDSANLYADEAAGAVIGEAWSGPGPAAGLWRFDLKAVADDPPGRGFAVHIPDGPTRDDWLRLFAADGGAGRVTEVCARGRLATFDAPTNAGHRTGLRLELPWASEIRLAPLAGP